jgi:hypothetical protein
VRGCGYGLQVREPQREQAETILKKAGIGLLGVVPAP